MNQWQDIINWDVVDNLTDEQVEQLLKVLENVK